MKLTWPLAAVMFFVFCASLLAQTEMETDLVQISITFHPIGKKETTWDGSATVSPGQIKKIEITRAASGNKVEGNTWKALTPKSYPMFGYLRLRQGKPIRIRVIDTGVILTLANTQPDSHIAITTAKGDFEFALKDVPYGAIKRFLNGSAIAKRIPAPTLIVSAPTEDDHPSAALAQDGSIYVAYMAFTHGEGFAGWRRITEPPKDFSPLAKPTGGDQLLLTRYARGTWSKPEAVTAGGEDLFKTAIAVDRSGKVWVFWSKNVDGNWDLFARCLQKGKWSEPIRLTSHPGSDVYPAAATDSEGRVWLTWMGFRGASSDIFALRQEGNAFGEAMTVCSAPGNQWDPAIASSKSGEVAIAWDTYQKGDYDVYCRIWRDGKLGEPIPVSASLRHEARPSLTYDKGGRLWIAHEDSPEGWGKDWGWAEKVGTRLYVGPNREVKVKVLADGKLMKPAQNVILTLAPKPKPPAKGQKRKKRQRWFKPPFAAPIIQADANGRVWLGVRSRRAGSYSGAGTVWLEEMTYYNGDQWVPYFTAPETDNLLDNRPCLIPMPDGNLIMVNSSDRRNVLASYPPWWAVKQMKKEGKKPPRRPKPKWASPFNNEIFAHDFNLSLGPAPDPKLEPAPAESIPEPIADTLRELNDVKRIRAYRTKIAGKEVRIFRGEFHRHTEISSDGGSDGTLQDMWRYALDAASMDWIGNGDHDNGGGREYPWWITQKTTDIFHIGDTFVPMFTYERSCNYPDGHRNAVFAKRGIRTLPRLRGGMGKDMDNQPETVTPPHTPDSLMFFDYLRFFGGVTASHTSATDMGTDWRDWGKEVEPFVEIYQGDRQNYEMPGAPRTITEDKSVGAWRPRGFITNAFKKGYRMAFQSSSDHISVHMSYCNVFVPEPTREAILDAMKQRHVYGSTDNIIADVRCGAHFMGEEFRVKEPPTIQVKLIGTQPFAKVHVIKDGKYVHTIEPKTAEVEFTWTEKNAKPGVTSYYYIRGEQEDKELVWASPMWIKYEPK